MLCHTKAELKVSDGSLFVQDRFEYGLADKQNAIEKSLEDAETVANKMMFSSISQVRKARFPSDTRTFCKENE